MIYLRLSFVLALQYLPCTTHNQSPLAKQVRRGKSATTNQLTDKMNFCHSLFYITPIFSIQETKERKRPKDTIITIGLDYKSGQLQRNAVNKVSLCCTFSIKALILKLVALYHVPIFESGANRERIQCPNLQRCTECSQRIDNIHVRVLSY